MKTFKTLAVIKQPKEAVWMTIRDQLPELVTMLDDIDAVTVRERHETPDGMVRLVNEWRVRPRLPAALLSLIDSDSLGWLDRAEWREAEHRCDWLIEPFFLAGNIRCVGSTVYEAAMGGRGTRITFEGSISIDASGLLGHAAMLDRPLSGLVETLVTNIIPKNFRKTLDAAVALLSKD